MQTGPHPPEVIVDISYSSYTSSLPAIFATITGHPRWPGYVISEFNVNITNSSDDSLLNQATIINNCGNNTCIVDVRELLPSQLQSYECTTLEIAATTESAKYGESAPTQKDAMIFKRESA